MNFDTNLDEFLSREALLRLPLAMVVSDPHLPDNPIVYVNTAFEHITGYKRDEAIGRNCRFLQGKATDKRSRDAIREAIEKRETATVDIYNYRADGSGFWNRLIIGPLYDDSHNLRYYFGIQNDMSTIRDDNRVSRHADRVLREVQHRIKNHLSMIASMIRMQARNSDADEGFASLANRVDALQTLYQEMSVSGVSSIDSDTIMAGAYVGRIADAISQLDGRDSIRLEIECEEIRMVADEAARLGLLASELLTNAFKHGFEDREQGHVALSLKRFSDNNVKLCVSDDGIGLPADCKWRGMGGGPVSTSDMGKDTAMRLSSGARNGLGVDIAKSLVRSLRATVSVDCDNEGTRFVIDIPYDEPS